MDSNSLFIASIDIASPSDIACTPFTGEIQRDESGTSSSVFHCQLCGNRLKGYDAKEEGRRHLNALLDEAYRQAGAPCARCPDEEPDSNKVEIPWGRPGTGCTLMLEALVMALIRRMSLRAAAGVLGVCDTRLWRVVDCDRLGEQSNAPSAAEKPVLGEASGRKGREYLNLFHDLEASFELAGEDELAAKVLVEERKRSKGKAEDIAANRFDLSNAFIAAVIEALLEGAVDADRFQVIRDAGLALGKVSAEEAMLHASRSRAPPRTE